MMSKKFNLAVDGKYPEKISGADYDLMEFWKEEKKRLGVR